MNEFKKRGEIIVESDTQFVVRMDMDNDFEIKYFLKGEFETTDYITVIDPEISYHSFNNFPYGNEYEEYFESVNSPHILQNLIKRYRHYEETDDGYFMSKYEKEITLLNYYELLSLIHELFIFSNEPVGNRIIGFLSLDYNPDFYPSKKTELLSNKILTEIINHGKEKSLTDRFIYFAKLHEEYKNEFECSFFMKNRDFFDDIIKELIRQNNDNSIFLSEILNQSFSPILIVLRVEFYLRKLLSDTAIKIQTQFGFHYKKLEKNLTNKDPLIIETFDLLSISLFIVGFEVWKKIILSDIKKISSLNKGIYVDNLKELIKTSVLDLSYRTGANEFFDYKFIVFDYRKTEKTTLDEVLNWILKINTKQIESSIRHVNIEKTKRGKNNPKLELIQRISPFNLKKIFIYYFETTLERELSEKENQSVSKFVFDVFTYKKEYNAFFNFETSIATQKIDFFNLKYKNEFRKVFMWLHNKKLFKNFSLHKTSLLLQNNFNLDKEAQFGKRGHSKFLENHFNKEKNKFLNYKFDILKISFLEGFISN